MADKLGTTTYNDVLTNTQNQTVIDGTLLHQWRVDIKGVTDDHANEINSMQGAEVRIINGNMEVSQEMGELGNKTIATATSAYTIDMFKSVNMGSGVNATASQVAVADLEGARFGLQIVHAALPSAQGKLAQIYTMEAKDAYKLAGKQVTFHVKVKAVAGMDRVTVNARYKTSESAISNSSTLISASAATAIGTSAWTTVPVTVTLPSRATLTTSGVIGIEVIASKTTAEASGDGFIIDQLDWNEGASALPFQPRDFEEELARCQRYYEKSYDIGIAPGTITTAGQINWLGLGASSQHRIMRSFAVSKRTIPTITLYSPVTGATGKIRNVIDSLDVDGSTTFTGNSGFLAFVNGTALTDKELAFHYAADARL